MGGVPTSWSRLHTCSADSVGRARCSLATVAVAHTPSSANSFTRLCSSRARLSRLESPPSWIVSPPWSRPCRTPLSASDGWRRRNSRLSSSPTPNWRPTFRGGHRYHVPSNTPLLTTRRFQSSSSPPTKLYHHHSSWGCLGGSMHHTAALLASSPFPPSPFRTSPLEATAPTSHLRLPHRQKGRKVV